MKSHLGLYNEELTAAVVYQAAHQDYLKTSTLAQPAEPKTNTCKPAGTQGEAPTPSRQSMYHMETLAENQTLRRQLETLQQEVQTLKNDIGELWSILNRAHGN